MDETLEKLPGEDEIKTIIKKHIRQECDICGEVAHYKHTYLLPNARRNPASRAYGRDDCSWSEDACRFVCKEHKDDMTPPREDLSWCSTFPANKGFAHMFLEWVDWEIK